MTAEELKSKITDYGALVQELQSQKGADTSTEALKQYDPLQHSVLDKSLRPDKLYTNERNEQVTAAVNRLALPLQKQIVQRAAAFLCGRPITLVAEPADEKQKQLLAAVRHLWDDNKLDYRSKRLAKIMMGETECAEIWYPEPLESGDPYWEDLLGAGAKFRLRMRIVSPGLGDRLYPLFAPTGDMVGFGRGYLLEKAGSTEKEERFDLYTDAAIYTGAKDSGKWVVTTTANPFKKIPIIYYQQAKPEWADVQTLIERLENQLSNHADTNDYFGSPILVVMGNIVSFSKKGESGKVMEIEPGASINYATWQQAPESVKLEIENLIRFIFSGTDTPNISFEEMKSLGTYSGIALKMLFMAAHMKAADKEEIFGECIQRRINFFKSAIGVLDVSFEKVRLTIKPKFEYFLPKDDRETVEILGSAITSKILSRETAVNLNPLVQNSVAELDRIKSESEEYASSALDDLVA